MHDARQWKKARAKINKKSLRELVACLQSRFVSSPTSRQRTENFQSPPTRSRALAAHELRFLNPAKGSGNILVVTLILAVILGTTLGSYLVLARTQNVLVT